MICKKCNKEIRDNAKFCIYCGAKVVVEAPKEEAPKVETPEKICPNCGVEYLAESVFCDKCGQKLIEKNKYEPPKPETEAPHTPPSAYPSLSYTMSMYNGTGGIAKATGKLIVYTDRIEFEKKFGSAIGNAFGPIGMLAARSSARKNGAFDVYYYRDVAAVSRGSVMLCPAFTLRFKDGRVITFAGAAMGGNVDQTISIIQSKI